jgi:hypothetical protein
MYIWLFWASAFTSTIFVEFFSLRPYDTPDNKIIWMVIIFTQTILWTMLNAYLIVKRFYFCIQENIPVCSKFLIVTFAFFHILTLYFYRYLTHSIGDALLFFGCLLVFILLILFLFYKWLEVDINLSV